MYQLNFKIETLSPVVISAMSNSTLMTGSHSEIGGSIIRGVLASKYVAEKNLGDRAHADKNFTELFYGGLKFLSANPAVKNSRSFILPLSLQRGKKGTNDAKNIADLLTEKTPPAGYKSLRGYGTVDGDKIFTASVDKNISMHMSRSAANERISGKSEEGHIYNYEALEEGQTFCGLIIGEKAALEKISAALNLKNNSFAANIGRSRFTQYGKCKFSFGDIEEIKTANFGEKFCLRLESPLIPFEDNFIGAEKILQAEVIDALNNALGKEIFSLGKIFASSVEIENFYMTMKRPRVMALAAGSVFEIESKNLTPADKKIICEKIYSGLGIRTEEGFGQIRFWQPSKFTIGVIAKDNFDKPKIFSAETIKIAQKILLAKYLEQIRIYAHEDAAELKIGSGNFAHFFSRLDNILSAVGKKNVRQQLTEKIFAESKDGSLFQDNLKNTYLGDQNLFDMLTESAPLPYKKRDLKKDLGGNLNELLREIKFDENNFQDEICVEYLKNFLRSARKYAVIAKDGDKND